MGTKVLLFDYAWIISTSSRPQGPDWSLTLQFLCLPSKITHLLSIHLVLHPRMNTKICKTGFFSGGTYSTWNLKESHEIMYMPLHKMKAIIFPQ